MLPKVGKITDLLIKHHHRLAGCSAWRIAPNEIGSSGYWIVDANSAVKNIIYNCVEYHRHRWRLGEQKMTNLPSCRLSESVFSTDCEIYMIDLIVVKQWRSKTKLYWTMFTCMADRAILKVLSTWILTHFNIRPQGCNVIRKDALKQFSFCRFCETCKNTFFTEHLRTTASLNY